MQWLRLGLLLSAASLLSGCDESAPAPRAEKATAAQAGTYLPEPPPDLCELRILELKKEEALTGAPELEEHRAEILARARSVPIVFRSRPSAPHPLPLHVARLRASMLLHDDPAESILEVLRKTRGNYPLRREVFLSDGYLYADQPMLALRLSQILRLDHLFSRGEDTVVIERGTETITVTRSEGRYFSPPVADGDPKTKHHLMLASLLLFDRVRVEGEPEGPALHVDLRPLQRKLGFSTAKITTITRDAMVAELSTYGVRSQAVLTWNDTRAELECETPGETPLEDLARARQNWHLDQQLIDPILRAAQEMIFRSLPFDEPKTEEGQQDGMLRLYFRQAYMHYGSTYEFNGDTYYVFDGHGQPRLPQVCIDFITDAFDWGTGGHWPDRGQRRDYKKGALNFASMGMENPRSVENLAEFATDTPEWFDVIWFPKSEQVKFRHRKKFFQALERDAATYRRGDIVFIYGLRDDGKFHYHSFLVDEKDPVTGMPIVLVANAGPPQARSWEGEMQNAPQRSIVARVRVKRQVLQQAHEQARLRPGVPLVPPKRAPLAAETEAPEESPGVTPPPQVPPDQLR